VDYLQAESPKEDHYANMEKMRDAQGKAEEYTYHSGPAVNRNVSNYSIISPPYI
jgi:hypothetical protein